MQETQVPALGHEDPLEEGTATHSSILAQKISWTEETGALQSMGLQSWTRLSSEHKTIEINFLTVSEAKTPNKGSAGPGPSRGSQEGDLLPPPSPGGSRRSWAYGRIAQSLSPSSQDCVSSSVCILQGLPSLDLGPCQGTQGSPIPRPLT